MPRMDPAARAFLEEILPNDPRVRVKPMFGNAAAFSDGTMFAGVFGDRVFLRLAEADRDELLAQGAEPFAPMPGRPMREYVTLPADWIDEPNQAREWATRALAFAATVPPRPPKKKPR